MASAAPSPQEEMLMLVNGYFCGALTANLIYLGENMGLYKALAEAGPCTSDDLASKLKLAPRYVAEWCRQQAAAKIITCDEEAHTFWLTDPQKDVLVHEYGEKASPFYAVGGFEALPSLTQIATDELPKIFRSGEGLNYDIGGTGLACGVCRELGVWLRHFLVERLRSIPGLGAKLDAGCAVADVGCGCGEAVAVAAAAFPNTTFHGFDISEHALAHASKKAAEMGVKNVDFFNPGVDEGAMGQAAYDVVMTHDAIHDMSHPQDVMDNVCKAIKPGGMWIIGDMSAQESHGANIRDHPFASFMYGFSCHLCLPSAMSGPNPAGLGTLGLSQSLAEKMLKKAGFKSVEVLDWGHPLNRYYLATKA